MKISKIIIFLKILLKSKYHFSKIPKKELIIFDGIKPYRLNNVIKGLKYHILETRIYRVNKIFISKKIIFSVIKNFRFGLFNSYLLGLIDEINPKVIFTFMDNGYRFSKFSELRKKNYKFVALQNGARYEHKIINLLKKKRKVNFSRFNIPYYLCFGQHEINDFKKTNQNIGKFKIVGSLKLSNYLLIQKKNKKIINKKDNDILFMPDVECWDEIIKELNFPLAEGIIKLTKFVIKFATDNNLKIKIAARSTYNEFEEEKNFYKNNLNNHEYIFLMKNIFYRKPGYFTYKVMQKSKVVVGTMSTMLRENLALRGKTFACNFTKTDIYDFPINGICFSKNASYSNFQKKLKKIHKISYKKYLYGINKKSSYVCANNFNKIYQTPQLIRKELDLLINKN